MIAILSDIHGNLPALRAVLEDARQQGCERVISLGDVVGYYAQPGECIDELARCKAMNILGNHDRYLLTEENCARSKVVAGIIDYHKRIVNAAQLAWLRESRLSHREADALFVHGGPEDTQDQYLYVIDDDTVPADVETLFSGHTHVQALINVAGKRYCNPGSVGQPRDGDCRAAYAVLNGQSIELRRVTYDIDQTVVEMKKAGFEPFYYENLYLGAQIGGRIDKIKYLRRNKHGSN